MPGGLGACQIGGRVVDVRRHVLAEAQPVRVSDWMIPATIGSLAGFAAGILTRKLLDGEHDSTKDSAAYLVNSGVFLIVGGLSWVFRQSRRR